MNVTNAQTLKKGTRNETEETKPLQTSTETDRQTDNQPTSQPTNQPTNQSVNQSINQSINQTKRILYSARFSDNSLDWTSSDLSLSLSLSL